MGQGPGEFPSLGGRAVARNTHPCECPQGRSPSSAAFCWLFREDRESDFPGLLEKVEKWSISDVVKSLDAVFGIFVSNAFFESLFAFTGDVFGTLFKEKIVTVLSIFEFLGFETQNLDVVMWLDVVFATFPGS